MVDIEIKKNSNEAKLPTQGSTYAAGWDLYADLSKRFSTGRQANYYDYPDGSATRLEIFPHSTMMVSTGISMAIPEGYWGGIYARSGLATKVSLRPANCVGVIDSDYRGDIIVALHNDSDESRFIAHNERIAQFVLERVNPINWIEVDDLDDTDRGTDGFGKSGKF